jgi:hypothetical protein
VRTLRLAAPLSFPGGAAVPDLATFPQLAALGSLDACLQTTFHALDAAHPVPNADDLRDLRAANVMFLIEQLSIELDLYVATTEPGAVRIPGQMVLPYPAPGADPDDTDDEIPF